MLPQHTEKGNSKPVNKKDGKHGQKIILIIILFMLITGYYRYQQIKQLKISSPMDRVNAILEKTPLIDTHNDLPEKLRLLPDGPLTDLSRMDPQHFMTDLNRMRDGKMGGQFWSAYIPCNPTEEGWNPNGPIIQTLEQIDIIKRMVENNANHLEMARTEKEIRKIHKSAKIASLIGIEGGHQINGSMAALRLYRELGVLYMTLTHSCHTSWADSCSHPPLHNGLTAFGKQVVHEMNRIGMMVDISHVSHDVMRDVIEITKAPLFASHSSVFSLCNTTRNIPDFVLDSMTNLDGVIMINFWTVIISCGQEATLNNVADHIEYVSKRIGAKHVGLGADFDGVSMNQIPKGLQDVSTYPALLVELMNRGFSDQEIAGIAGENILRVLKKTEQVSLEMKVY